MTRRKSSVIALFILLALGQPVVATDTDQPPGRLYDVGTHRLHLYCAGRGSPAVLFESGLGGIGLEWMDVLERVARQARACYYDRAGYGWSEAGPLPRTAAREADELARLLRAAGIDGRILLVAHSYGGYVAQVFARAHPERLAGLVLVESSHPAQLAQFPIRQGAYCMALARGLPMRFELNPILPAGFPRAYRRAARARMVSSEAARAQLSELCNFAASAAAAAGEGRAFPQLPLVIVSRGRAEFPAGAQGMAKERAWSALQDDLGRLSGGALKFVAASSGHHVHLDQPGLVAGATLNSVILARSAVGDGRHRRFATWP